MLPSDLPNTFWLRCASLFLKATVTSVSWLIRFCALVSALTGATFAEVKAVRLGRQIVQLLFWHPC